ncbi:MAG: SEC-C metal-binding domain-containing protein [Bacteroidota bacterium]
MGDKLHRNDPCHCGSGKKYKNCCQKRDDAHNGSKLGMIGLVLAVLLGLAILGISLSGGEDGQCPPGQSWDATHGHCH